MERADSSRRRLRRTAVFLLGACVFGLACCQAPLYYSNQNQYFLHGLANAGFGSLDQDWLANTLDPTPVFTLLVTLTVRLLQPWAFHLYYVLLFGVYLASLVGLVGSLAGERDTPRLRLCFVALLLAVHSALARWASYRLLGLDYPWYFQAGVAGQYVLGAMFQPSAFGVLLILAIALFVKDRPYAAVFSACLAAAVHFTYLLGAATLTLAFLYALWLEGQPRRALLLGGWGLLLALPVTLLLLTTFRPTSAETFAAAQRILAHERIPHHCLPRLWYDEIAVGQLGWVLLALFLIRGTRLFAVLLGVFLISLALTLLQVATASDSLALLFPWRTSAVLVPIATAIILGRGVIAAARWLDTRPAALVSGGAIAALVAAGLMLTWLRAGFQSSPEEQPLLDFVKANRSRGDQYLLPVRVPDLKATTRGSLSSDFKPAAAKKRDSRLIPVDLQRFRLYTGAPIFVDFKSIPYKDTDALEWRARLQWCQECYRLLEAGRVEEVLPELRRRGITHVVTTAELKLLHDKLSEVHQDDTYRVYHLQ